MQASPRKNYIVKENCKTHPNGSITPSQSVISQFQQNCLNIYKKANEVTKNDQKQIFLANILSVCASDISHKGHWFRGC